MRKISFQLEISGEEWISRWILWEGGKKKIDEIGLKSMNNLRQRGGSSSYKGSSTAS
jgi:hypothetical protein